MADTEFCLSCDKKTMTKPIEILTGNFLETAVGSEGISPEELYKFHPELQAAHRHVRADHTRGLAGEFAALQLGREMPAQLGEIRAMADALATYSDVLLIGIGGSSLGAKALRLALMFHIRENRPRLHFIENIDTYQFERVLSKLEPAHTALVCISKSGGTIESAVHFLILRDWLARGIGATQARQQQWIVTDPDRGWLRELVRRERLPSLPVPPQVGGRYSVLTAVGLLPLAAIGVDIESLLKGAADNEARCQSDDLASNPAMEIAAYCYLMDRLRQKRISVMMPYVNRLQLFVDWYCQLWAESLGKWDRSIHNSVPAGTLPVRAMGAIDQHSQLQMYLESRHDKFFTFIELEHWEHDRPIPLATADQEFFPYLKDRSMAEVIHAELQATRSVITEAGHPNMTIRLPAMNPHVLGQLIDLYQRATIYTGLLYGINPLDQPSVEKGKMLAIDYLRGMT
jgi:glucose-6-phosphate isomerase